MKISKNISEFEEFKLINQSVTGLYEKQVEKLEAKAYRTPTEEQTLKQLKKQKLEGKTRLHAILDGYNEQEGN